MEHTMQTNSLLRLLAALALSAILAACGGGGGGGGSGGAATPVVTAPPPPPPPPPLAYPIPAGLWTPPANAVPATGNYVYLQSDAGDYIGAGRTWVYTNTDTLMTVADNGLAINVGLRGDETWNGSFLLPGAAGKLQAGYFSGLTRTPFADAAVGGVEWSGEGRGCNTLTGWVVIDNITVTGGVMTALDLRFEQHCEGGSAALHGKLHWTKANADSGQVPGPASLPSGLWAPAPSFVPPAGNYVYLVSDIGDYIGGGTTRLLTANNATFDVVTNLTAALRIDVGGWSGNFVGMNSLSQLQPGYYGGLRRYPFNNPVKGGLDWSGNGRGCNVLTGWFAVDKVTYTMAELSAIDLRFEQHCEGGTAALHGVIHWAKP
jgi:hypothetical protein